VSDERRLRLQHFVVQPVLVYDDGDELSPAPPVDPQALTLVGLRELAENWPAKLAELDGQAAMAQLEAAAAMRETQP
jgi:hypothetical protein